MTHIGNSGPPTRRYPTSWLFSVGRRARVRMSHTFLWASSWTNGDKRGSAWRRQPLPQPACGEMIAACILDVDRGSPSSTVRRNLRGAVAAPAHKAQRRRPRRATEHCGRVEARGRRGVNVLFLPLAKIRTCFSRWPRSGLVLPGQDPDLSHFGQDQDLFWPRPDENKSGSWPAWQNKSGSWPGRWPRSGLKKISPDLGQGALAKIRTYFRFFFRANPGPRGRARQVRILPMGAGQVPDLKE